jgi:hypothetical protein
MSGNAPPIIGPWLQSSAATHAERFEDAWRAVAPSLLFGLRLWASVSLALCVAYWLELDNPAWAGTTAAIVCQPQLGTSLRKGWFRMIGTVIGAAMSVVLAASFPQDRLRFLGGLAVWCATCAFAATLLRNFASYAAALAGCTAAIIAGDLLGAASGAGAGSTATRAGDAGREASADAASASSIARIAPRRSRIASARRATSMSRTVRVWSGTSSRAGPAGRSSSRASARSSASCASAVRPLCRAVLAASRNPPSVPSISSVGDARSVATPECVLNRGPLPPGAAGGGIRGIGCARAECGATDQQASATAISIRLGVIDPRPLMVCGATFISDSAAWAHERGVYRDAVAGPAIKLQPSLVSQRYQPAT